MQKDHTRTLKILQPMSEFGGLWKRQNNPASTKSVKSLQNVKVGHYPQEDEGRDVEKTGRGRHAGTSSTGAMPLRAAQMMGQQAQMMGQQKQNKKQKNK